MSDQVKQIAVTLLKTAKNCARQNFEKDGHLTPVLLVSQNNKVSVFACVFNNDEEKDRFGEFLGHLRKTCDAYVLVTEAWMSICEKDKKWDGTRPSKDPNRKEAIVLTSFWQPNNTDMTMAFIERDWQGTPTLGEWQEKEFSGVSGRFLKSQQEENELN